MLNNARPSMIWHLYDYNLDAVGRYFGVKKACVPPHIQCSRDGGSVVAVNSTYPVAGLRAGVQIHNLDWKTLFCAKAPHGACTNVQLEVYCRV